MHKSCISPHKHQWQPFIPVIGGKKLWFNTFWDHKDLLPVNFLDCGNKVSTVCYCGTLGRMDHLSKKAWAAAKRHHFACSPRRYTANWLVTSYATTDGLLESPSLVLILCPVIPICLDPHMHVTHPEMILNNVCIIFTVLNNSRVCLCENGSYARACTNAHTQKKAVSRSNCQTSYTCYICSHAGGTWIPLFCTSLWAFESSTKGAIRIMWNIR